MTKRKFPNNSSTRRAELIARPAGAPAYFRGRPATVWLSVFGKTRRGRGTAAETGRQA
jgi:hypothetical protein